MILGPNDPRAIVRKRHYYIVFKDREGNEREFSRFTTWPDFLGIKRWLISQEVEVVKWGIYSPSLCDEAEEIIDDFFAFEAAAKTD